MLDRAPTKPNRYAVYDDAHNFLRYEYHERADEPTEAGTPLNKATLLTDTTATALGLTGDSQIKDALLKLSGAALRGVAGGEPNRNILMDMLGNEFPAGAQIEFGSYVGTGAFGTSNKNSLTFRFQPKVVMLHDGSGGQYGAFPYIRGCPNFISIYSASSKEAVPTTVSGNTMSWYNGSNAQDQYNQSGETYSYVAIG